MIRLLKPSAPNENEHPAEEALFCYLDGELTVSATARIRAHLEACWTCRVKVEKIQQDIASFIHLLNNALVPDLSPLPPPLGWRGFETKVSRVMAEMDHPSILSRWLASAERVFVVSPLSFRLASALLLGCLIVFWVVTRFDQVPSVSASQLLERATEAELRQLGSVSQPVVYRKLRVQRLESIAREDSLTWELWSHPAGQGRFRQRVEDGQGRRFIDSSLGEHGKVSAQAGPDLSEQLQSKRANLAPERQAESSVLPRLLQELEHVFQANHLDWRAPLSPAAYAAWRQSVPGEAEQVIETKLPDGSRALALTTAVAGPLPVNAVVKAELVVRAQDWHPVQQSLRVQGEKGLRDYELVEIQFQVIALNTLPPSIFPDVNLPQAPLPRWPRAAPAATPTADELMTAEMEAQFALHRLQACRLDPIEVAQDPMGVVEVRGLVRTSERKEELQAALHTVPLLRVKLQTMEEAATAAASHGAGQPFSDRQSEAENAGPPIQEGTVEPRTEVEVSESPIQDRLERYFSEPPRVAFPGQRQEKIHELSNQAFSLSQAALSEAWALRRLAERYPSEKASLLRPASRWLLETMVRDHLTALRTQVAQSHMLLEPVVSALLGETDMKRSAAGSGAIEGPDFTSFRALPWTAISLQLFHTVESVDRLTLGLFLGVGLPSEQAEDAMRELLAGLSRLKGGFQGLEEEIVREFSGNPDLLSQQQEP